MPELATTLEALQPNPTWAFLPLFDRTGWTRVRFGDVVENCAETCEPAEAGLERFVAMEHLEPGSLHVRSWGNVADGTTFTRRCRPGQVLFGKRRAYQRKVAVAEFEAVVSGDIYVLAPRDGRLLPELLPFLCLSERFFQHAVGTSAGSLSPRTNWSSLASFEFDLPPLDQQRRIAEILWAVDEAENAHQELADQLASARLATVEAFVFGEPNRDREKTIRWPVATVGELCHITSGKVNSSIAVEDGQYPFFTCAPEISKAHSFSFDCEALLLAGNNPQGIYTVKHFKGKFEARQRVYVITISDPAKITYRYLHLMMQRSLKRMQNLSVGSTSKHITLGDLQGIEIPLPSAAQQDHFVSRVSELESAFEAVGQHVGSLASLKRRHLETALNFNAGLL